MANIGTSAVRIIDSDSDVVTVNDNRLDVNSLVYGYDYSSANRKLKVDASGLVYVKSIADSVTVDAGTNLNTSALSTHVKQDTMITALENIEDAADNLELCVATDGSGGPTRALSIAGTESGGNAQEIRVDGDGHLQVDILSGTSVAVTGTFWQSTQPVSIASGGVASGGFASGSVASGAFASGSISDGAMVTIGAKADAKSTATDTTSITMMQVLKQVSASVQSIDGAQLANSHDVTVDNTVTVQGAAAADYPMSGNPVPVGALYAAQTLDEDDVGYLRIDSSGILYTTVSGAVAVNNPTGMASFESYAVFEAAQTPTAINDATNGINSDVTDAKEIIIQAAFQNSSYFSVGDSGATANSNGIRLNAGDTLILPVADTGSVYIDGHPDNQMVCVTIIK